MSSETPEPSGETMERERPDTPDLVLTPRVILTAMGAGLIGMIAMLPLLVGLPLLLGVFRFAPVIEFAGFAEIFGLGANAVIGVVLFVLGGTVVLPLTFLVVGAFLPPETPRYLRGVTFATTFWLGFVLGFWPRGGLATQAAFVVFSLLAHWIYGLVLGLVIRRTIGIPQHSV